MPPSNESYDRVKELFLAACEMAPDERVRFLNRECGDDQALRADVEALLGRDDEMTTSDAEFGALAPRDELGLVGREIGGYRVRAVIASGGMGSVYEALQEQPRRTVALKVMKQGIASRSALRRFEYEAQILGRLRHPGIAQIFEAGVHYETSIREGGEGMPYFAMEYVPGARTILDYAEHHHLGIRERLGLFAHVCEAVQCGHQQGIIHRDLKPANILIDSSGNPKIIDFGVARATDADLAVTTAQTNIGQLIGTVRYMSPEQCAADPHDLDIRSDVYSLGVVLYELLTGRPPYDLTGHSVIQATRVISETEAPRPSAVDRTLRGDIEAVVLKALEKDRSRRYQSASELAQDLQRHLANQPIIARPPSTIYYIQKFARRNKAVVAAAAVIFLTLLGGIIAVSLSLGEARLARDEAEQVTLFLEGMLKSVNPEELGRDVLVRDVLDESAATIGAGLAGQPSVEGRLRHTIGVTYLALGEFESAMDQLEQAQSLRAHALGPHHRETLRTANAIGECLHRLGRFAEAESIFRATLGARDAEFGADDPETVESRHDLAITLGDAGRLDEAYPMLRDVVNQFTRVNGADDPMTLNAKNALAVLLYGKEEFDEASSMFRAVLEKRRRIVGEESLATVETMSNLAMTLLQLGEVDEGASLLERTVGIRRRVQGRDHPHTLDAELNLAMIRYQQGLQAEAEELSLVVFDGWTRREGPAADRATRALRFAGRLALEQGDIERGAGHFEKLLTILNGVGRTDEIVLTLKTWAAALSRAVGPEDPRVAEVNERLEAVTAAQAEPTPDAENQGSEGAAPESDRL